VLLKKGLPLDESMGDKDSVDVVLIDAVPHPDDDTDNEWEFVEQLVPRVETDIEMEGEIVGLCEKLFNKEVVIKLDRETEGDLVVVTMPVEVVERHSVGD
jgi:redox-regulated HSP33 family molecular chaperone